MVPDDRHAAMDSECSSMRIDDLVTVIIPVRNRPDLLREAVESVLSQTYRQVEIVIVDDGSVDDTALVAEELRSASAMPIEIVRLAESGGPGPAREQGRMRARGEFIQYLDSDDLLLPSKLQLQVEGLRRFPECGVSYGKTVYTRQGEAFQAVAWKRTGEKIESMFPSFIMSRWWGTSTPLYRRSVCDAAGPWKAISNEQDWEYDCRVAALGIRLHFCDAFVSHEREHDGARQCQGASSLPSKLAGRAQARHEIWKTVQAAGVPRSTPEVQFFARSAFLLSRQCGNAGLTGESIRLFELAREASTDRRSQGWDFRLYGLMSGMIGWPLMGRMTCTMNKMTKKARKFIERVA
jgi:hypothetical protein